MTKRGRPTNEEIKSVRYTVRMDDAVDKRVSQYCARTGKTRSDVLREAVEMRLNAVEEVEQHGN